MSDPRTRPLRRTALLALGLAGCACATASAQTLTYTLTPPYQEGVNGANGWYRVPVNAVYACNPPLLVAPNGCPGPEKFGNRAGTAANPAPPPARLPTPIIRTATFVAPFGKVQTQLFIAPNVGLKIDTSGPDTPTVTVPTAGAVYDAGSAQTINFGCNYANETSGPAPANPCVATLNGAPVANGARLDTGAAGQAATWGPRDFAVTSTDLAGNVTTRSIRYSVDELPGAPVLTQPAAAAITDTRPTFMWTPPTDMGSGFASWRLRVTSAGGSAKSYTTTASGNPVSFQPPDELPAGSATWAVTLTDTRGRSTTSESRSITINPSVPTAPRITSAPGAGSGTTPTFSWTGDPGGTFTWEITDASGVHVQGGSTATTTVTAAALAAGTYAFHVRQTNGLGRTGDWSASAAFTVVIATTPPVTTTARITPKVQNAHSLHPRAGVTLHAPAWFTWRATSRATLYNFQVFRLVKDRYVKVFTAFPRGHRYRLRKHLTKGGRYVWRVWPYLGHAGRYTKKPLGISWFDAR
ncbi:MAG: hypothetical protein U0Y82_05705 [Thermoleophilia bacterium]